MVVSDVCMREYTEHGHCGLLDSDGYVLNDEIAFEVLGRIAVSHAEAGADVVAPSGMIDGMVRAIRGALDGEGLTVSRSSVCREVRLRVLRPVP